MNSKDSLVIFIDSLGRGGAEGLLVQMVPLLRQEFSTLKIYCLPGKNELAAQIQNSAPITYCSYAGFCWRLFRSHEEVVYVHLTRSIIMASIVAIFRSWLGRPLRCVAHLHTTLKYYEQVKGVRKISAMLFTRALKRAARIDHFSVVVSTQRNIAELGEGSDAAALRALQTKVFIFPNAFSRQRTHELATSRAQPSWIASQAPRALTFCTMSRLDELKQLDWAIRSVHAAASRYPALSFCLKLGGRGPDDTRLRDVFSRLTPLTNLKVEFLGFVPKIEDLFASSDIYLFPSRLEGFPLSLTEAALTQIYCIANDCPNGPKDLSVYFPHIRLVSPPTYLEFEKNVLTTVEVFLATGRLPEPELSSVRPWPCLEDLIPKIAKFMKSYPCA